MSITTDNVHFQNSAQLVEVLTEHNINFRLQVSQIVSRAYYTDDCGYHRAATANVLNYLESLYSTTYAHNYSVLID